MTIMGAVLIKYEGPVPGNINKSEWRREILKPSWHHTGKMFHEEMLPSRFTREGAKLLNYTPRKGQESGLSRREFFRSYSGRKQRIKGHQNPLMWSGVSEKLSRIQDIRATSNGVRIVNHAKALNFKNPKSKVNMRDEVRRVADSEVPTILEWFNDAIESNLSAYSKTKTTKVSG